MQETLLALDHVRLNFSPESLHMLNISLAFIMFGVALEIKLDHFKKIFFDPKSAILGSLSQFILLPFITFLLTILLSKFLSPSMALGMILVAACPGGNISNFISSLAKGNVALSVSLTAIATLLAIFLTPLNFAFWGKLAINFYTHSGANELVRPIEIDAFQMYKTVFILLGLPLIIGIIVNTKFPSFTLKIVRPIKRISILIFAAIVVMALANNFDHFIGAIEYVFLIVLIHNAIALGSGYLVGTVFKRPLEDRKTISIETGIQNSGLALVLIFNPKIFPPEMELGGMAIVAAWWGIWHIIAGLGIAGLWTNFNYGLKKSKA